MSLPGRRVVVLLITAAVVGGGGYLVWSDEEYKQWPWNAYPSRLHWCGRDWQADGATASRRALDRAFNNFHRAGDLPGILNVGSVWTGVDPGSPGETHCRITAVYVQVSSSSFEEMALLGE